LINIGAYVKGTNPNIDAAIQNIDKVKQFLRQKIEEPRVYTTAVEKLLGLAQYEKPAGNGQ